MDLGYINRKDAGPDRCPKCNVTNTTLGKTASGYLFCLACRTMFISKADVEKLRAKIVSDRDEAIKILKGAKDEANKPNPEATEETESGDYICQVCGKVCKNAFGLAGHLRSHKDVE
jgi:rubrerythrin